MGDDVYLVVDAPLDLNRLWFAGAVLGCAPPVSDLMSTQAVHGIRRGAINLLAPHLHDAAVTQWHAAWQAALVAGAQRGPATPAPGFRALHAVLISLDAAFQCWWSPPTGARFALEWWTQRLELPAPLRTRMAAGDHPVWIDVVGLGDRVELHGTYRRTGANTLVRLNGDRLTQLILG